MRRLEEEDGADAADAADAAPLPRLGAHRRAPPCAEPARALHHRRYEKDLVDPASFLRSRQASFFSFFAAACAGFALALFSCLDEE